MKLSPFMILAVALPLAATVRAQNSTYPAPQAILVGTIGPGGRGEIERPRMVRVEPGETKMTAKVNITSIERVAFDLLNKKREENGLNPLAWNADLERVAQLHSQDMADHGYFSHRGLDGTMVSDRADKCGLGEWRGIGENIAFNRGYQDPVEMAVELWMGSTPHRHNLLDQQWKESAIGVAVAPDGSYYFTQVFLVRK